MFLNIYISPFRFLIQFDPLAGTGGFKKCAHLTLLDMSLKNETSHLGHMIKPAICLGHNTDTSACIVDGIVGLC